MSFGNLQFRPREANVSPAPLRSFQRPVQVVNRAAIAYRAKSQTDLTVLTADGDRVTISLAAQSRLAANQQSGSQSTATSSASQLRIAVEGSLSDAERQDIVTLLGQLASSPAGPAPIQEGKGLSTLAAFRYRYQQSFEAGF